LRVRLTAWYIAALTLMLVAYATTTYLAVRREFREQLENEMREHGADAATVARADEQLQAQLAEVRTVLVVGLPFVVALSALAGYVLAGRALAPIDQLAAAARRITAARLHERLTARNDGDEIGRLTAVINDTFARLESSFDQLRRFTADASHELRTPLAVIRSIGEETLRRPRAGDDYKQAIGSMLEEIDRLTHLVDTLLRLSYADAGTQPLSRATIDLGQLAQEVVTSLGVLAEERSQRFRLTLASVVNVSVDRQILREAITNVVDNAIKYSPAGSTIEVSVSDDHGQAVLTVSDAGPGIEPSYRERIFDRFFRVDEARSRSAGGTGLGLAIAKWAVDANGGAISVDRAPAGGSTFRIVLPLA
jgi:heavy metal sensor kinase